jgi:uncharacterized protein
MILLAVSIALAWIAVTTLWLWYNQERVVFQPPVFDANEPVDAQRVDYRAADGMQLFGYLVQPDARPLNPTVVIAFHGNADIAAWLVPWARETVRRLKVVVFIPEYRGYAGLSGSPTYANSALDARGALQFVRELEPSAHVVLFGHSLGTAIATDLATWMQPNLPSALVLQAPFTSALDMAARMLVPPIPWLWKRIARVHYDTRSLVARLDCQVWVAHGTRDLVVPTRMGRQVFAAARHPGVLLLVDGAGHNDVPDVGGDRYWKWLAAAVTSELTQRRS